MKNRLFLNKKEIINILGEEYNDLASIMSDKFGIINAILERNELKKYKLYMFQCLSANTRDLFDLKREVSSGGLGINETIKDAMIGCLAEALERYCMSFIPQDEVIFANIDSLNKDKLPKSFFTYNNKQYKNNCKFSNPKKESIHWTKIFSVDNDKNYIFWPASLIYLPFEISKPVAENTSTGMAAGITINDCIESGLLELLERDALMINFLQRLNPPEVILDSITGKNKSFIKMISKEYSIKIYKLYSDINVPIYFSLIWKKQKNKVHFGIGASASFNSDYAINKSLKECLFTFFYSKNIMDLKVNNPNEINKLYEHFLYYQGKNFEKLIFNSEKIEYKHEETNIHNILKELKNVGINVYYKNLTTDDIKETKIKVVKVIAPGLIDLNKSHILPRLGATRFWSVPKRLGLSYSKKLSEEPHPFP